MDNLEEIKKRAKLKRNNYKSTDDKFRKYADGLITRVLISVIFLFLILILCNKNNDIKIFVKEDVMTYNIPFNKITNLYNKYFGSVIPIKSEGTEEKTVFSEKLEYNSIETYKEGYLLKVKENYLVPIQASGIVVFVGEKEGYGKTVIVQGNDLIDYWYGNITNESVKLYDYVTKGELLGTSNNDKLYLVYQKNGEYLGFDEVNK